MVCVTARRKSADPELTHGVVYEYDLTFKTETETEPLTLAKALKSPNAEAVSYGNRDLPTFVMPPFTLTDDPESHLLSFGEFLAMYLFVWSDVLWPATLPESSATSASPSRPRQLPRSCSTQ